MRKIILISILCSLFLSQSLEAQRNRNNLKVEPAFWWVDMPTDQLQVMIYGKDIAHSRATIDYKDVTIRKQVAGDSHNYLFIYLEIGRHAEAGTMKINLKNGKTETSIDYELKNRVSETNRNLGFNSSDVIYLLMPDRFANGNPENDTIEGMLEAADRNDPSGRHGGDLRGVQNNLDYIKELGMTAVWLTPVFENDMKTEYHGYHGYAATDMYKVDRRFGTNDEFVSFVKASHDKGLKVIMDMIHNHIGDQHWWMKDLPFKDWVHDQSKYGNTNFRGVVASDPYASTYDMDKLQKGWFVNEMPDLNQHNEELAFYLIQNTLWWIEYSGVDGIRMDTYVYPYADYMARWAKEVLEAYPNFNIVGESWVETVTHEAYWQEDKEGEGDGYNSNLPSVTDFQIQFALRDAFNQDFGWDSGIMKLYYAISQDRLYSDPKKNVIFMDNHDISRFFATVNRDLDKFKMAYAYLLTTRGIPQVYYGTELAMDQTQFDGDGYKRADMAGGWPGDERSVFIQSGRSTTENDMFNYVAKLTNWRKGSKAIHDGELLHFLPENNIYTYFRYLEEEKVMVIMNANEDELEHDLGKYIEMLEEYSKGFNVMTDQEVSLSKALKLPGKSVSILELK
jgi:glycosidase